MCVCVCVCVNQSVPSQPVILHHFLPDVLPLNTPPPDNSTVQFNFFSIPECRLSLTARRGGGCFLLRSVSGRISRWPRSSILWSEYKYLCRCTHVIVRLLHQWSCGSYVVADKAYGSVCSSVLWDYVDQRSTVCYVGGPRCVLLGLVIAPSIIVCVCRVVC